MTDLASQILTEAAARAPRAPRERGILFSAEMVRAILAGRKTQTRRVTPMTAAAAGHVAEAFARGQRWCPYGEPGDLLNIRETWATEKRWDPFAPSDVAPGVPIHYVADGEKPEWAGKIRPSIFLPAWGSRVRLRLDEIRVQRLHEISEEDAIAEGVRRAPEHEHGKTFWMGGRFVWGTARAAFAEIWASVNNHRAPWDENPWCWCLTFSRLHQSTAERT